MKKSILFIAASFVGGSMMLTSCAKKTNDVKGCKDQVGVNYDANVTVDDGSCLYPDKTQRTVIMDISGTWCPPCGSYGIPGFRYASKQLGAKCIAMSVHTGDAMENKWGKELYSSKNYTGTGVPRFIEFNSVVLTGAYPDSSTTASKMVSPAMSTVSVAPSVNCHVSPKMEGENLTLNVKTKWFKAGSGEYFITAYLLRDGIVAAQKMSDGSTKKDQVHDHVLSSCLTLSAFGDALVSGEVAQFASQSVTLTGVVDGTWDYSKVKVATVIWKKNSDNTYSFVNGTEVPLQ